MTTIWQTVQRIINEILGVKGLKKWVLHPSKDEKGMPIINFKIVDARNLKRNLKKTIKIWHIYSLRF